MFLVFHMDQGNLIMMFTNIINLKRGSMWWKTLIPFPRTSNPRVKKLYNTGCCIELVLFHWGVWQQKFLLQPTPLFCDSLVRGSFFALLLVLVLLTQSDPLSCWCRVNEMTPFVGKNCKRSWSMRYPSFAVWQHLFLASRRIVGSCAQRVSGGTVWPIPP